MDDRYRFAQEIQGKQIRKSIIDNLYRNGNGMKGKIYFLDGKIPVRVESVHGQEATIVFMDGYQIDGIHFLPGDFRRVEFSSLSTKRTG